MHACMYACHYDRIVTCPCPCPIDHLLASARATGADLNKATDNGLERAAAVLGMTVPEVKNRATITGAIEIGRHPGVITVTLLVPKDTLHTKGLLQFASEMYM